ncbi:MAG TPA: Gfo/Idh/MocA family oxidoreductase, partial [Candidatus Paceibacterota bacterium]|nr:Gfo/Idh/MocA family oxidoreductase [Candidatus Paceibacterota bacterium]
MTNIKVGVIGYGYWGPNIVRNFFATPDCTVRMVADGRHERLNLLAKTFPSIQGVKDAEDIIGSTEIDAIVIATPVHTHFELARRSLLQGKHVLIEKPMTSSVREADELIELATKKGLTLMADHTFLYTGAVQKMKEIIQTEVIGTPLYFDSSRINLGLFQPDINVLWDLA